jgi:hypothetical protein
MNVLNLSLKAWSFVPKNRQASLGSLVIKFSQEASLQSDPHCLSDEFSLKSFEILNRPFGSLAVIYALSLVSAGSNRAERTERLLEFIWKNASNLRFQGGWTKVGKVLHQDLYSRGTNGIEQILFPMFSEEDLFGNFLPLVYLVIEKNLCVVNTIKRQRELSRRERFRGIRKKIRRRGYNDKGSRRPDHEDRTVGPDWELDRNEEELQELIKLYSLGKPPKRSYYCKASGGRIAKTRTSKGGGLLG